jgi:tRNA-binding protein
MTLISYADFLKIEICVGTILSAEENNNLKQPSIILTIDFGTNIGIKKSSAQLKKNYNCTYLINKQIVAVVNFHPKQIGNLISEVLVLGFPDENNEPVLVSPELKIKNGKRLY